jgi:AcrR family transcriptional regulator
MTESATRTRTRRAILDAAVSVLARDPSASLGEVAAAADVGRTTLHRYFAERSDLMAALAIYAHERVAEATARAALSHGAAPDALGRLCREYFELGDVLTLMFGGTVDDEQFEHEEAPHDRELAALIERGQAEGTVDPQLSVNWIVYMLWALLYTAWSLMREASVPRHEALEQCLRSLHKAVAAP